MQQIKCKYVISEELHNKRLDIVTKELLQQYSRSLIQQWIKAGYVLVDGRILQAKDKIFAGQVIEINAEMQSFVEDIPQELALNIIYEDQDIIIIDKPVGLVVHPGAGNLDRTLLNALLYRYPKINLIPRCGIIHRLDKDTSGLLVIARTLSAHTFLIKELQFRKIHREYEAIVNGKVTTGGVINVPIGRHSVKRTKMSVQQILSNKNKSAITHYRVIKRFAAQTHLKVILETGRTHQIRVHLAHIGYPIIGDKTYSNGLKFPAKCSDKLREALSSFKHQALHACSLELTHPETGKIMNFKAEHPSDFKNLLCILGK